MAGKLDELTTAKFLTLSAMRYSTSSWRMQSGSLSCPRSRVSNQRARFPGNYDSGEPTLPNRNTIFE